MAWIESHQALEKHPKLLDLTQRMGWSINEAIGRLHRLWWWTIDFAPNGDLRKYNAVILAGVVGVSSDGAEQFVNQMVETGWLDRKPYLRIHDWWDYAGRYLQVRYKHNPLKWQEVREAYQNGSKNSSHPPKSNRSKATYQPTNLNQPTNQSPALGSNPDAIRLSELLRDLIRARKPDFKEPLLDSWIRDMDRLLRIDKRSPDEINAVIRWCQQDPFWQNNILSVGKLRQQYDQLELKRRANPAPRVNRLDFDQEIRTAEAHEAQEVACNTASF